MHEMENNGRVAWIDYMSGIGTLMVFMQHSCVPKITRVILGFHMPLFFWISGYLYQQSGSCNRTYGSFICSRWKRLMVPYLLWFAINGVKMFLTNRESLKDLLHNLVYCTDWFLPCLFISELAFHFINKEFLGNVKNQWITSSVCAILFWLCSGVENLLNPSRAIFCLDTCLMALGFMFSGAASVQFISGVQKQKRRSSLILAVCFACLGTLCVVLNKENFMMYQNQYGNYLYAISGAILLIFSLYFAVKAFDRYLPKNYLLYLRHNGLFLFLVHFSIISMTKELIPSLNTVSMWVSSFVFLMAIHVIGMPACYVVNRWIPILAGKSK